MFLQVGQSQKQNGRGHSQDESNPDGHSVAHHGEGENQSEGDGNDEGYAHGGDETLRGPGEPLGAIISAAILATVLSAVAAVFAAKSGRGVRVKDGLAIRSRGGGEILGGVDAREFLHQHRRMIKAHRLRPTGEDKEKEERSEKDAYIKMRPTNELQSFAMHRENVAATV